MKNKILATLETITDPILKQNIVSCDYIKAITYNDHHWFVEIVIDYISSTVIQTLNTDVQKALAILSSQLKTDIKFSITSQIPKTTKTHTIQQVKRIIAIASGKGGVGKSTIATYIALALQAEGAQVGILDADIQGPSIGHLLNVSPQRKLTKNDQNKIIPLQPYDIQMVSMAALTGEAPVLWRGPMIAGALLNLAQETQWDNLDYLIVDLPPGTGDIHLSLLQKLPLDGTVIVSTPAKIATLDVEKTIHMLKKFQQPILGIVENLSVHTCEQCGHTTHLFDSQYNDILSKQFHIPILAQLPYCSELVLSLPEKIKSNQTLFNIFKQLSTSIIAYLAKEQRKR